ncbi:helix-turn-helix domain-containing protein [Sulfurimonas aquatica]|uniref:Helix-turn-helix domain-containing protein n=1 Tax=Sulfurimonas aquatica TaxID=2672570 RepID=A0A975GDA1_9BACT|nr:Crp/Fnr family transcriptional regulator [Sulfurimonas aquatica]QSZ42143.1 helix-turn-helix domain-containing protein [Sulfurimonas aquatica]
MDTIETKNQSLVLHELQQLPQKLKNQKNVFFKKGEDPLNSVDTSKYFYFVLSGKIKIFQIDFKSSKEQILYLLSRGDMFDVVSLLDGTHREQISEVLEDTELIQIPLEDVKDMILLDNNFRQLFYSYLAMQLKSMENLAISLSFYDVYQRVLQLFTRFTYMKDDKAELKIIDNLKHEDIASMVGTVRKVVNRSLQKLKQDGIIELSRKKIHIKKFQEILDRLNT